MYAIKTVNLCKKRGDFELNNINFELPCGCIMGLVGENGAGKSTIINLLISALKPDSGSIELFGSIPGNKSIMEDIGVVLSEPCMPVCMNAKMIDKMYKNIYKNWSSSTFFDYTKKFNIPTDKKFSELSLGNKMKLSIACAMSHNAKLLILDEATSGLDPVARDDLLEILRDFTSNGENSVLISSHIVSDLEKICDYAAFVHDGSLMLCGEKDEMCEQYVKLQCTPQELKDISTSDILGERRGEYSSEVIVRRSAAGNRDFLPVSLEELFVFIVKYGRKGA